MRLLLNIAPSSGFQTSKDRPSICVSKLTRQILEIRKSLGKSVKNQIRFAFGWCASLDDASLICFFDTLVFCISTSLRCRCYDETKVAHEMTRDPTVAQTT